MSIEDIKRISIKEFLKKNGISPKRENSYSGMYISPLRQESTASFKVNYVRNLWFDYGLGKGGSIIDLVMAMQNCDLVTAIKSLEEPGNIRIPVYRSEVDLVVPPSIEIKHVGPLVDSRLLYYLRTRGIKPEVAIRHCREVYYKFSSDKLYYAIGFHNDAGGWELRNSQFKGGTSPKTITSQDNGGDTVAVFEGFMDYLSYLSMKKEVRPQTDAIILNSVTNLPKALPWIKAHGTILTYLDNDKAGRSTTEQIREQIPGSTVIDRAELYRNFNDLNDYWKNQSLSMGVCMKR